MTTYDPAANEIIWSTGACRVTRQQGAILMALIAENMRVVSWDRLMAAMPDCKKPGRSINTLKVQLCKLRHRLLASRAPVRVVTIWGSGVRCLDVVEVIA